MKRRDPNALLQDEGVEAVRAAMDRAEPFQPVANGLDHDSAAGKVVETVCAADIPIRAKSWVWAGRLLRGGLELVAGAPGLGKSQVHCHYAACVTTTKPWPDGSASGEAANVIMVTAEDCLDDEVVPRLVAAGADVRRVYIVKLIRLDRKTQRQFLLAEDLDTLEKKVREIGDVALVMIDPITAFMGGKMDSHKATEVRSQLGPLKDFAERLRVAVSAISHPAKNAGPKAIDHVIGSQAFVAAARIVNVCVEEMEEGDDDCDNAASTRMVPTGRVLFTNAKNNAAPKMPTLAYRVVGGTAVGHDPHTGEVIEAPRVIWDGVVDIDANQAVADASGRSKANKSSVRNKVQAFLEQMLASGRPVPQSTIMDEGQRRGFSADQIKRAKAALPVQSQKDGFDRGWVWSWTM